MTPESYPEQVKECAAAVAPRLGGAPLWGIIMGSGQRLLPDRLANGGSAAYEELPHFPRATSPSHRGRLHWGELQGRRALICQGRLHSYEGHSMRAVAFPVRVMAALGVRNLIITNAAGGLNPLFKAGDLMLLADHLNFLGDNPLVGENVEAWGPRFPDMSRVYDWGLREAAAEAARRRGLTVRQGVYVAVKGPCLETPAETRFLRRMGADAVGMSTVPEAIAAVHAGLRILGVSVISNLNLPDAMAPVTLEEILATVAQAEARLVELLLGVLEEAPEGGA